MDRPVAMINVSGGNETWYYYYADVLGSIRLITNSSGVVVESYTYDVYGQPRIMTSAGTDVNWLTEDVTTGQTSAVGNRLMFTARDWDSTTGLYYYRARDYSPTLGRFLQPDPVGYADSMNLYQYCGNNPVNWIDPWGLATDVPWYTRLWNWFWGNAPEEIAQEVAEQGAGKLFVDDGDLSFAGEGMQGFYSITGKECVRTAAKGASKEAAEKAAKEAAEKAAKKAKRPRTDLPGKGKPNSSGVKDYGNGKGQIRDYGPDGKAKTDYDFGHDHTGAGDPHAHDWTNGNRSKPRPLKPGE
jgi:RHS repeat-associated protein